MSQLPPTNSKRKYQVIWETLKSKGKCTVEVHPALCGRVKKAVIKEKNNDLGFKVLNDHDYFFLKVEKTVKTPEITTMTFKLKQRIGVEGVRR